MQDNQVFAIELDGEGEVQIRYSINFGNPQEVADLIRFLKNAEKRLIRNLEVLNEEKMKKRYEEDSVLNQLEEDLEEAENLNDIWDIRDEESIWISE